MYICEEIWRTSLFVVKVVLAGESCFGVSDTVSVIVFQRSPSSPTVGLGSLVLLLAVIARRRQLLDDHDRRLKLAWLINSRDCL